MDEDKTVVGDSSISFMILSCFVRIALAVLYNQR